MDGKQWTKVISNGEALRSPTTIRLNPVQAKFLRITLTKSEEIIHGERRGQPYDYEVVWNMRELKIYGFY